MTSAKKPKRRLTHRSLRSVSYTHLDVYKRQARIEYKKAWNPQAVLHTLCAFANDIDNWGGGYIVIGLSETNGQPILPPTGLPAESLDSTMKELLQISKLIKPEYLPICEPVTYEGRNLLLIWAPGGYDRPYDCPESLSQNAGRSSYIRKMSNTIKASRKDVQELHDIGSNIPYDDRLNLCLLYTSRCV